MTGDNVNDEAHIIFVKYIASAPYSIIYVKYTYSTNSLGTETTVYSSLNGGTGVAISIDMATGTLYGFWSQYPTANHFFYKKCVSGTWDTDPTDWINEATDTITSTYGFNAGYRDYGNYIGFSYETKTASPYNVKFAYLSLAAVGEYSFTLSETAHATANWNIQQEHSYTFTGTIIQSSILEYGAEARQTLTQTVTSSGTTYYWMELSYPLTETAKPTATHGYGLEGIFTLTQTVTSTETRIILQEQLYTFTQTTTSQTILTYAAELAETFITNIETITPHEIITYWIESPIDWSMVAIGLAMVAFIIAAAAIALR
jgi:hypothetical protein